MLRILRQRLAVELAPEQARAVEARLAEAYPPLISGVKREYLKRIGLAAGNDSWLWPQDAGDAIAGGELYLVDEGETILYFKSVKGSGFLEAGTITRRSPQAHQEFFAEVRKHVQSLAGSSGEWQPMGKSADSLQPTEDEGGAIPLQPTHQEVEAARELERQAAKDLLGLIIQRGSVFFNKLIENRDRSSTERFVQRFEELGIVSKDYAVLCSKTGQQILRVASRAAIDDPSHKTFKCFICGKPISEETVDEIITSTDFGKKLLERDYWLLVRAIGALQKLGIDPEDVTLQASDNGISHMFVSINQEAYLFVLANKKLALPDAYVVSAHVTAFGLDHVVLISTEKVSNLMKYHLETSNPSATFSVVESLKQLEERLEAILREREKRALRDALDTFASLTPVRIQELILQRVTPEAAMPAVAAPPEAPAAPEAPKAKARSKAEPEPEPTEEPADFMEEVLPP